MGEAGPGPSYLDEDGGGQGNAWTTRNAVFMTWNMLHFARMLKDTGGIPAYGNSTRLEPRAARPPKPRIPLDTPRHPLANPAHGRSRDA